jgi:hypothetical protein
MRVWTGLNWLIVVGYGPAAAFYEDVSGFHINREFTDQSNNC